MSEMKKRIYKFFVIAWVTFVLTISAFQTYQEIGELITIHISEAETGEPIAFTAIRMFAFEKVRPYKPVTRAAQGVGKIRCPFKLAGQIEVMNCLNFYSFNIDPDKQQGSDEKMMVMTVEGEEGNWVVYVTRYAEPPLIWESSIEFPPEH